MPYYKGTLLFEFQGKPSCGFSESIEFFNIGDLGARNSIADWPAQRINWLNDKWKIVGYRLSRIVDPLTFKSTPKPHCVKKFEPVGIGSCTGTPTGKLPGGDSPYTAVLVRISFDDPTIRNRNYMARGVPDSWYTDGGLSISNPDGNKFLAWFNFMVKQKAAKVFGLPSGCSLEAKAWKAYCVQRVASKRVGRPFGMVRGRKWSRKKVP